MKRLVVSVLVLLLMFDMVFAMLGSRSQNSSDRPMNLGGNTSDVSKNFSNALPISARSRLIFEGRIDGVREQLRDRELLKLEELGMNISREYDDLILDQNKQKVRTRLNLSIEENGTLLKVNLSNGRNAEIKMMPSTASQVALERLGLKVCSEERNCTIVLKEVGSKEGGNQTELVYEASLNKEFKVFGLFRHKHEVMSQVDAETGEIVKMDKPWWAFLATEEKDE